jgi:hypothetical protein
MEELTNYDIWEIYPLFKINLVCCDNYKNIFDYDLIDGASYILNLGNKHWTCLYFKNNKGLYFDSYGIIYPKIIKQFCPNIIYNKDNIQSLNSVLCGYYCLFFLYWMTNEFNYDFNYSLNKFRALFSDTEKQNGKILQNHIKKII